MDESKSHLADVQESNTATCTILTGAPRSGTTLLGILIGSLGGIDYHHEPPMFWVLSSLFSMKALSPSAASCLLKSYLHEELLIESVHGRRANLRPTDDSLVLKAIHWEELIERWQRIKNRADAIQYVSNKNLRLAVKTPSVTELIPFFETALPKSRFIVIIRDGRDVVRSILRKGWLTDEGLKDNYWPYKVIDGQKIPSVVEDSAAERWVGMSATARACYLWGRDAEHALRLREKASLKDRIHVVMYEQLRRDPVLVMRDVAKFLSTEMTDLTELGIQRVRPLGKVPEQQGEDEVFRSVEESELRRFRELNAMWGYR